jgi:thioredoxin-like negative regulator of GroEL
MDRSSDMYCPSLEADFHNLVNSAGETLVVAKFGADWCEPSHDLNAELEALASQRKDVIFLSVDVDECKELS